MKTALLFRLPFLALGLLSSNPLYSQKLEFLGGINRNVFWDGRLTKDDPSVRSSNTPRNGFCVGFLIDSVRFDKLRLRFGLMVENYGGKVEGISSGRAGGSYVRATTDKTALSFIFIPASFSLAPDLDINIGLQYSRLIYESTSGEKGFWLMNQPDNDVVLDSKQARVSSIANLGLHASMAYNIIVSPSFQVVPQFIYNLGFGSEFRNFPTGFSSIRYSFTIGVKKSFMMK